VHFYFSYRTVARIDFEVGMHNTEIDHQVSALSCVRLQIKDIMHESS